MPEGDCLDLLATLLEAYETRTAPTPMLDPITTILMHLENRGLSRRDSGASHWLARPSGRDPNRRRTLTLPMIRRLHDQLGISIGAAHAGVCGRGRIARSYSRPHQLRKAGSARPICTASS